MFRLIPKWPMGFAIGILFHWLIVFLYCFIGEDKILVPALSRNFQYVFLSVTTFLWGMLGGTVFILWAYSRKMKEKGLTRRYFASLGFLIGTLGAAFLLLLLIILPEPLPLMGILYFPAVLSSILLPGTLRAIGFRVTDEMFASFAGLSIIVDFVFFLFWGITGTVLGYIEGLFKEKQTSKRSDKDEEKN